MSIAISQPRARRTCRSKGLTFFQEAKTEDWDKKAQEISAAILRKWAHESEQEDEPEEVGLGRAPHKRVSSMMRNGEAKDLHAGFVGRMRS
jgi:hypothetical protein